MELRIDRTMKKVGHELKPTPKGASNMWTCSAEGFLNGIGKTETEARESFFRANIEKLGFTSMVFSDPTARPEPLTWKAYNR